MLIVVTFLVKYQVYYLWLSFENSLGNYHHNFFFSARNQLQGMQASTLALSYILIPFSFQDNISVSFPSLKLRFSWLAWIAGIHHHTQHTVFLKYTFLNVYFKCIF